MRWEPNPLIFITNCCNFVVKSDQLIAGMLTRPQSYFSTKIKIPPGLYFIPTFPAASSILLCRKHFRPLTDSWRSRCKLKKIIAKIFCSSFSPPHPCSSSCECWIQNSTQESSSAEIFCKSAASFCLFSIICLLRVTDDQIKKYFQSNKF